MDRLDVRIIRGFMQGHPLHTIYPSRPSIRPGFRALSQELAVSESTVRDRFQKLSGFLAGWSLMLNPGLVGEKIGALELEIPEGASKDEILERLRLVEEVFLIVRFSGPRAAVAFFYPDDVPLERRAAGLVRIAGCRGSGVTEVPSPRCVLRLSRTDLQVIASRQEDATKSDRRVADELGISSRTVKRRFTRLVEAGAILPVFSLHVDALEGCVYSDLHVEYQDARNRDSTETELLSLLEDSMIFNGHFVDFSVFNLILPNIPSARAVLDRAKRLRGVRLAWIDFVEQQLESYGVFREKVKRQLTLMTAHRWK